MLEGVITSGTGAGYTYMGCSSEAGKTGTSEDLSDAWFVGYTPLYSTAVWTGHPLSRDSTGFGGPTSGPIWRSYMEAAQGGECPEFPVPSSLPDLTSYHGEHTSSSSSSCSSSSLAAPHSYSAEHSHEDSRQQRRQQPGRLRARAWDRSRRPRRSRDRRPRPGAPAARGAVAPNGGRNPGPENCPLPRPRRLSLGHARERIRSDRRDQGALPASGERVRVPSGDDAAVVEPRAASAITVDAVVDGVHFSLEDFGRRRSGARRSPPRSPTWPRWGSRARHTSWSARPAELADEDLLGIADGLAEVAERQAVTVAGGDLVARRC